MKFLLLGEVTSFSEPKSLKKGARAVESSRLRQPYLQAYTATCWLWVVFFSLKQSSLEIGILFAYY